MKTITQITITLYHDGITDEEIVEAAKYFAELMEEALLEDTDIENSVPENGVTVHTASFKVV